MSKSKTDWSDVAFIAFFALLVLLFAGTPDLYDVILYSLSDGAAPLPEPTE